VKLSSELKVKRTDYLNPSIHVIRNVSAARAIQNDDEFICKVAKTPNGIQELIENGFEYICNLEDLKFFRKRK